MSRHCALIVNPTAGSFSERKLATIVDRLAAAGFSPEICRTGGTGDAAAFARRVSAEQEEPFLVACGGDGTVNGVINGLEPGRATLAVLPFGTSNVLARELGIDSIEDGVRKIAAGVVRPLSVGVLESAGERRFFILMAGVGFDGAVVEKVRLGEKRNVGKLAYLLSALRLFGGWERGMLEVVADGKRLVCHSVVVCNASRYGGDIVLARDAAIFSPGFIMICIRSSARRAYLALVSRILAGRSIECSDVAVMAARELAVSGDKAVQLDGDFICRGPVTIRAVDDFARLIV